MPILNLRSMERMVELSAPPAARGDHRPASRRTPTTRPRLRAEGIAIATELCDELLDGGAPGLHFYTLNRSKATREIFANLQITV